VGSPGDDILIAGRTTFDVNDDAVTLDFADKMLALLARAIPQKARPNSSRVAVWRRLRRDRNRAKTMAMASRVMTHLSAVVDIR